MKNKISVIVPFYKSEKTIERCLDSILAQTYTNFEVLVVSDGSPDNSEAIVKNYAAKDDRIKLIINEHGGVSKARNRGIDEATGDYIQFVDSDDYILPTMFEKMVNRSIETNADIVACDYDHPAVKHYFGDKIVTINTPSDYLLYCQSTFTIVVPWNKLYKRHVITEKFDESVHFTEDDLFGLSNMGNAKIIAGIDEKLYHYYVAPPGTPFEDLSCINKIALADDYWITKQTYWYLRTDLLEKSLVALRKTFDERYSTEFAYARVFDFMVWELVILATVGQHLEGLTLQAQQVFIEERFIKSLMIRDVYGISYNPQDSTNEKIALFAKLVVEATLKILSGELKLIPFHVSLNLFAKMFLVRNNNELDTVDNLARSLYEVENNTTEEAKYVNSLF